jgi:hypothetical protein
MGKPIEYGKQVYKPVDYDHDLSRGKRAYLKVQGITEQQFRKMDAVSQREWLGETQEPSYEHMRRIGKK